MQKLYGQQHNRTPLRKWIILIITLFVILLISLLAYLYVSIVQDKSKNFSQTETEVLEHTDIVHINKIERFHDEKYYHVVYGENESKEGLIAFVSQSTDDDIVILNESDMIDEETLIGQWAKDCQNCKKVRTIPALIENEPYWEITFYDADDQYTISYYAIDSFELVEQLTLNRMFN